MATQPKGFVPGNYRLPGGSYVSNPPTTNLGDVLAEVHRRGFSTGSIEQTLHAGSAGHLVVLGRDGQRIGAVVSRDEKPVIYELYLPK